MRYFEGRLPLVPGVDTVVRCWCSKTDVVILGVHGFAEHGGRYAHVGEYLSENGMTFCIYDLRGHGLCRGWERGYVESFNQFVEDTKVFRDYTQREFRPSKTVLLGHSMGGLIALYYAVSHGDVDGLILSAAATELRVNPLIRSFLEIVNTLNPRYRVRNPVDSNQLTNDKRVARGYIEDKLVIREPSVRLLREIVRASREVWRHVGRVKVPVLIMHGTDDGIIPYIASRKLYKLIGSKDKTLKLYQGMKHELLNEVEKLKVLKDLKDWVKSRFTN